MNTWVLLNPPQNKYLVQHQIYLISLSWVTCQFSKLQTLQVVLDFRTLQKMALWILLPQMKSQVVGRIPRGWGFQILTVLNIIFFNPPMIPRNWIQRCLLHLSPLINMFLIKLHYRFSLEYIQKLIWMGRLKFFMVLISFLGF